MRRLGSGGAAATAAAAAAGGGSINISYIGNQLWLLLLRDRCRWEWCTPSWASCQFGGMCGMGNVVGGEAESVSAAVAWNGELLRPDGSADGGGRGVDRWLVECACSFAGAGTGTWRASGGVSGATPSSRVWPGPRVSAEVACCS